MAMPDVPKPAALPRVTSQALAMRPRTRRIFGAISVLAVVLATLLGATVAALGEQFSGPAPAGAALWGGVGAFVAACLGVSAVPFARRLLIARAEVRLVEAASPLHPLLRRLMIEAPGTYAHSLATASLAEAGAEAIGADPLLARVGAYYHDVGKIRRPCFFFENIADGENPHDSAKPSLSALVITAHVSDGLELADEYDLPMRVRDIIREHHGTSLIRYFYHKASSLDPAVSEGDFRYHGGRPTTREAALVMLADSAEASVRALAAPDVESVQEAVRGVFEDKSADGQLELAGFGEGDLSVLTTTFARLLVGMLHARCEYPRQGATSERGLHADQHR